MHLLTLISVKKLKKHKKLFINVLNQLKSNNNVHIQKSAGYKLQLTD